MSPGTKAREAERKRNSEWPRHRTPRPGKRKESGSSEWPRHQAKAREAERSGSSEWLVTGTKAREAERRRQQRLAASPGTKAREAERRRQQRVAASPGTKAREMVRKRRSGCRRNWVLATTTATHHNWLLQRDV
ncbi:octapeptide-repeat protein T2-like [Dermacentor silvarum]|uniref:octapeptide-repeat protein T2-like n=1 Tax=Dermacentor silvarum TaxID=543639 RepID=UPI00189A78F3|nr:octapeptide-repeat protein T2-like [Dermacentor silvarum]